MTGRAGRRAVRRWSRRLLRREWRQQLVILGLLSVTVAAAVFAATAAYNVVPSRDAEFGRADVRLKFRVTDPAAVAPFLEEVRQWFATAELIDHRSVAVPGSTDSLDVRVQAVDGPLGEPMLALRQGRAPTAPGEVALTDGAAHLLGATLGQRVRLGAEEVIVVGLVENPADLDDEFALAADFDDEPESITVLATGDQRQALAFRSERDPGPGVVELELRGRTESGTAALVVLVVASVAMLLVSLVAGAAFLTVAQRRRRQLGLLAAAGATPRQVGGAIVAHGTGVGSVAALLGTAVGLTAWVLTAPLFEGPAGHRIDRLTIPLWVPLAGVLLVIASATAAAWWPARSVARISITEALSSRPSRPRAASRSLLLAAGLLVAGLAGLASGIDPGRDEATPPLFLAGLVAMVAALLLLAPRAVGALAGLAVHLPVAGRLALRDLDRHRSRAGAGLGAISLGVAIAVAVVAVAAAAVPASDHGNLGGDQLIVRLPVPAAGAGPSTAALPAAEAERLQPVVAEIAALAGGASVVPFDAAVDPSHPEVSGGRTVLPTAVLGRPVGGDTVRDAGMLVVATPEVLAYLGVDPADADGRVLLTADGGVAYVTGNITSTPSGREPVAADRVRHIDVAAYTSAPRNLITPEGMDELGLVAMRTGWLLDGATNLGPDDLARIRDRAAAAGLAVETRDAKASLTTVRIVASVGGVALALAILAMILGLLRREAADDVRTLVATGASPRTRRDVAASAAAALAALGVVLGTGTAYAALVAGYWPEPGRLAPVPVADLAGVAFGLPVLAAAASWILAGRSLSTLRPRVE